ncbi:MAG TPA: hypothetical protein VFQ85_04340 [Mycobacteriales bacterium]|jgi:hypothetical protein|nr:hypothetical protein [Mycobacteriales bacterium]
MRTDLDTRTSTPHDLTTTGTGGGRTLSIVGFVCAALSLLFLPIVFGPAAIICGIVAWRKGDRLGVWAAVAGVVCMIAGMAIGVAVLNNARNNS